jgi:hypothetical protein
MPGLRSAASLGLLCTTLWAGTGFAHGTPVSDALLLVGRHLAPTLAELDITGEEEECSGGTRYHG